MRMDLLRLSCCLAFFAFFAVPALGVQQDWNRTFGGPYGDGAWSLQQTDDGGYIIAGYTCSRGEGSDLWLVKTDSDGQEQWNRTFGGSDEDVGYSVKQVGDGGYIIAGSTKSYGVGEERLWLLKTDSNGSLEWDRTLGGFVSSSGDAGWAVDETDDGGYIVVGYTRSRGAGAKDLWLVKTDSSGNPQWDRTFGGAKDDVGMSVIQTRDGGYVTAGRTASSGQGDDNIWLLKVDPEGIEQWNRTFGGSGDDVSFQVIELEDGYALTGRTESGEGKRAFLIKTDLQGKKKWQKTYGKDSTGISAQQTDDGGFIIAGSTEAPGTGKNALLIKTDSSGKEQWTIQLGGSGEDIGTAVVESSDREYVLAGTSNSFRSGEEDAWLIKLIPDDLSENATSGNVADAAVPGNATGNITNSMITPDPEINANAGVAANTKSMSNTRHEGFSIPAPPASLRR